MPRTFMQHQHVGYLLSDVAMKIEAPRYLSWKSAHYLDLYDSDGHVSGAWSKIFGGETCVEVVYTCMRIMGVNSYDRDHPLEKYMREALCFPIYDAGNIGMQRRKIHGAMAHDSFDPRALRRQQGDGLLEGYGRIGHVPEPSRNGDACGPAQRGGLARGPERADELRAERRPRPLPSPPLTAAAGGEGTGCQAKTLSCVGACNVP